MESRGFYENFSYFRFPWKYKEYRACSGKSTGSKYYHPFRDGADDIVDLEFVYRDKQFYQVAGNCDWGSSLPLEGELKVADKTIFFCTWP